MEQERSYGSSLRNVKQMWERKQVRAFPYTPLVGGFLFALAPVVLRGNMRAMLVTQLIIGVGTFTMAQGVATCAIVKERSHA